MPRTMVFRASILVGNWWLRIRYPDTGLFLFGEQSHEYKGRKVSVRCYKKVWPKLHQRNAASNSSAKMAGHATSLKDGTLSLESGKTPLGSVTS